MICFCKYPHIVCLYLYTLECQQLSHAEQRMHLVSAQIGIDPINTSRTHQVFKRMYLEREIINMYAIHHYRT